ncbi:HNH endonuclease [Vibrio parahaemolyticus]|uniref:HNH endonuclease signature motif containing protein n=1 Tax=Vibrio parahaemolyticus TaxID=670 RepID=UPI00193F70DD|nr:HNH endonuclease signature motif containing protein [Vibrio parahaemolyticus]EGR1345770.1 HNH endonuclease [Vibrio parahaemolyticus]EIC2576101.1 HNH endonuclease [Vibrio parahaemolyticus]EID0039570.1 HNH endonuclease [Vibrio parahaemolyticus]ELA9359641.1 HNH endonuclease [Vibrio parahaemolyticus]MBM4914758.1 HNH endonuclease [Vibrio parahaemolyticus]
MAIGSVDTKILWGRAGGRCSMPGCNEDLTSLVEAGNYVVGEMAHVIGSKPTAARGTPEGGADTYDNLILLCPTHHTHIDKAPEGTYTVEMLHEWKRNHEAEISSAGKAAKFDNFAKLQVAIARLLAKNKAIFDAVGPLSDVAQSDPSSNAFLVWELRRIDRILPNNREILNLIDANEDLIEEVATIKAIEKFRVHVESYEKHVYERLDSYPLFPTEFVEVFS